MLALCAGGRLRFLRGLQTNKQTTLAFWSAKKHHARILDTWEAPCAMTSTKNAGDARGRPGSLDIC